MNGLKRLKSSICLCGHAVEDGLLDAVSTPGHGELPMPNRIPRTVVELSRSVHSLVGNLSSSWSRDNRVDLRASDLHIVNYMSRGVWEGRFMVIMGMPGKYHNI